MALDLNMVKAVIFDMDGLLVNSEPYWKKAVIRVFEGLGLQLNDELYLQTQGLRIVYIFCRGGSNSLPYVITILI